MVTFDPTKSASAPGAGAAAASSSPISQSVAAAIRPPETVLVAPDKSFPEGRIKVVCDQEQATRLCADIMRSFQASSAQISTPGTFYLPVPSELLKAYLEAQSKSTTEGEVKLRNAGPTSVETAGAAPSQGQVVNFNHNGKWVVVNWNPSVPTFSPELDPKKPPQFRTKGNDIVAHINLAIQTAIKSHHFESEVGGIKFSSGRDLNTQRLFELMIHQYRDFKPGSRHTPISLLGCEAGSTEKNFEAVVFVYCCNISEALTKTHYVLKKVKLPTTEAVKLMDMMFLDSIFTHTWSSELRDSAAYKTFKTFATTSGFELLSPFAIAALKRHRTGLDGYAKGEYDFMWINSGKKPCPNWQEEAHIEEMQSESKGKEESKASTGRVLAGEQPAGAGAAASTATSTGPAGSSAGQAASASTDGDLLAELDLYT